MSSENLFTSHKVGTISYVTENRLNLKSSTNQNKGYITSESSIRLTNSYVTKTDFNSSRQPITAKF